MGGAVSYTQFVYCYFKATKFTQTPNRNKNEFWNCHLAILCWVAKPIFLTLRMPVAWSRRHLGGSEPTPGTTSQSILLSLHLQRATCRNGCGKTTSVIPLIIFVFAEFGSPVFVQVYLEGSWPWKWMSVWLLEEFLQRFQLKRRGLKNVVGPAWMYRPAIHGNKRLRHPILFPFRARVHKVEPIE